MKKNLVFLLITCMCGIGNAQKQNRLEVIIPNVKSDEGVIMVALFTSAKTFTKEAWKGEMPAAKAGEVKAVFENIPAGQYAIAVYHDANRNGKLDSNLLGMPKEGFGFSKDAMGTFGPPSFEKAQIDWTGKEQFTIHLKYL